MGYNRDLMGIPSGVIKHGRLRNHHKLHVLMVTFKNIRLQWNGWRKPSDVRMISHWSKTSFEMPMRPGELEGINTNPSNQYQTCWTCCWHDFEPGRIPNASYFWGNRQKKTLPGVLTAADPFFWFCHGDFYLYTFPANQVGRAFDAVFVCYQISRVHKDWNIGIIYRMSISSWFTC